MTHKDKSVAEHAKSPLKYSGSSTPAPSVNQEAAQPQQLSIILSTRNLILSTMDNVVNSIALELFDIPKVSGADPNFIFVIIMRLKQAELLVFRKHVK